MNLNFLEFEQPIAELEAKIEELRYVGSDNEININEEIGRLQHGRLSVHVLHTSQHRVRVNG